MAVHQLNALFGITNEISVIVDFLMLEVLGGVKSVVVNKCTTYREIVGMGLET